MRALCDHQVAHVPHGRVDGVCEGRSRDYSVNDQTKTEGARYSLRDVYGGRIYVQYGLKEDTSLARNPVMRFYPTPPIANELGD